MTGAVAEVGSVPLFKSVTFRTTNKAAASSKGKVGRLSVTVGDTAARWFGLSEVREGESTMFVVVGCVACSTLPECPSDPLSY